MLIIVILELKTQILKYTIEGKKGFQEKGGNPQTLSEGY